MTGAVSMGTAAPCPADSDMQAGAPPPEKDKGPGAGDARALEETVSTCILPLSDSDDKQLSTLRAQLAHRHGIALFRLSDGSYLASRWNLTRPLRDLHAVAGFLRQLSGGAR